MKKQRVEIWRILPIIVFLAAGLIIFACFLITRLLPEPPQPNISVSKMKVCLYENDSWTTIDSFKINDDKYLCAEMKSDDPPVMLTLIIEPTNAVFKYYSYVGTFNNGTISFFITDDLPAGAYTATILYARDVLATTRFIVVEGATP